MSDPFLQKFNSASINAAVVPQFFMHEGIECVKILIAGNSRFQPVFRAADLCDELDDFGQPATYAERYAEQYAQFKAGSTQVADGTPLEQAPFLNPSRIQELRALKVFSIEALSQFPDNNISRLGGNGYFLKTQAQEFLAKRGTSNVDALAAENAELLRRIQALEQAANIAEADEANDKEELKEQIAAITGQRPKGNPSVETLRRALEELTPPDAA